MKTLLKTFAWTFTMLLSTNFVTAQERRLSFNPRLHGFHFANHFVSRGPINTAGLCGGMVLAAFNHYRFGVPIPQYTDSDFQHCFEVNYDLGLNTSPNTHLLVDYIFHSQLASWQHSAVPWFFGAGGPTDYNVEFNNVKGVIDRGRCVILGLKGRPGNNHHQVLCYGYDERGKKLFIYDPNFPDNECVITLPNPLDPLKIEISINGTPVDSRYAFVFLTLELNPAQTSNRTTYDVLQNPGINFAVRPPAEAFIHRANSSNISSNSTYLDNPYLNGNPRAVILVTPGYSSIDKNIGVWYDSGRARWAIFNQDRSAMTNGHVFYVTIPVFKGTVHRSNNTNITSNWTYIDHLEANNNPQALVFVTQRWNPNGSNGGYNNKAIGVWYDANQRRWAIFNEDVSAMGAGLDFNILVLPSTNQRNRVVTLNNNSTPIPYDFGNGAIVKMVTHNYNPNLTNGNYLNATWGIGFNPDINTWQVFSSAGLSNRSFNVMRF